jgi:hypothetical protein
MTPDPQLPVVIALVMGIGWTMYFSGLKRHMLERKQRARVCPSCGRTIAGRVCDAH